MAMAISEDILLHQKNETFINKAVFDLGRYYSTEISYYKTAVIKLESLMDKTKNYDLKAYILYSIALLLDKNKESEQTKLTLQKLNKKFPYSHWTRAAGKKFGSKFESK